MNQRTPLGVESVFGHLSEPGNRSALVAEHRKALLLGLMPPTCSRRRVVDLRCRPDVLASVVVLQTLHGMSGSKTTDATAVDLGWKAAISWPLTAEAFHDTAVSYWHRHPAASPDPNRIFYEV